MMEDRLVIGGKTLRSRLFVGTGKFVNLELCRAAIEASGAEVVTVAVRRVDFQSAEGQALTEFLIKGGYMILPNTAGCYTAEDAVRTARLARELLGTPFIKLEVIGDPKTLFPDVVQTIEAAKILVREGFAVMAYTNDDPVTAKRLEELGCVSVMPLGAPIGSGLGIRNPYNIEIILEQAKVPIVVDAGVGTASDVSIAMELGCHAVLVNTAIAQAKDPVRMARAMRLAVEAGREAFLAGRIPKRLYASASSPLQGVIGSKHQHT
ncbi:MAG: thiazole synthase [Sandaracinaceae bacterium]|nr:thiazole synthase [Sandaracinaceae bacterium]MDW8246333.1 thiazole synthase [Sandaracinaceae bacterium]